MTKNRIDAVIWPQICRKFKEKKKEHKLTNEQLAMIAGCKRPNMNMFINGQSKLGTDALLRISKFFGIDPRDFIDWEMLE